jgi:hypothetical protein
MQNSLAQDLIKASEAGDLNRVTEVLQNKPGSSVLDAVGAVSRAEEAI